VTTSEHFIALLVTVLTGISIIMGGGIYGLRILWNIRGSWDTTNAELRITNAELKQVAEDTKDIVNRMREEHDRMDRRTDRLEQRMERHEHWHAGRSS